MAKSQSNKLFDGLAAGTSAQAGKGRKRNVGLLEQRDSELSELTSGAIEDKVHRWIDPARCRMWARHNRRYDLLTQSRCQDLIDGFKSQGRQEFPAIVRKIDGDDDFDYEVICGARRHWTVTWLRANNYPEFKFLIEIRDLTDEQAFRLSDIENRDNLDLSDYERAIDYKDALGRYYHSQKDMAARLEVSEGWLSRYLDLAAIPNEIVQAFADVTEIRTKHGRDLKPYLKDKRAQARLIEQAVEVGKTQKTRIEEGRAPLPGASVVKALIAATAPKKRSARGTLAEYRAAGGEVMLSVNRQGRSGLILRISPNSGASKEELIQACGQAISEHL